MVSIARAAACGLLLLAVLSGSALPRARAQEDTGFDDTQVSSSPTVTLRTPHGTSTANANPCVVIGRRELLWRWQWRDSGAGVLSGLWHKGAGGRDSLTISRDHH